ncbi:MAG TPA: glycine cleavage system aminomethyltransferase GcvT [Terriglobia bacterium]|nr:glycine cleavage system aminomethyltransferase GcvT [Terriglobia bacterium]
MDLAKPAESRPKRTALHSVHKAAGARMTEFGGWDMPIEYAGITQEHLAVRQRAGLFDVSHMGEIAVRGPRALAFLQSITCNDVSRLSDHQAQYSALMHPEGSAVDDCVIHRMGEDDYFICVNAANTDKDFEWLVEHNTAGADLENVSSQYSQLALQGPKAAAILGRVTDADLASIRTYWFTPAQCCGVEGILARTGYTGEDGFEFYFSPEHSETVWNALLEAGRDEELRPVGLGARNTLRLESAYALYGHELDEKTTLLEANLGWICKLDKGEFLGRDVLLKQREEGVRKKLVGFEMAEPGIARDGYAVWIEGEKAGQVTSGSPAPFLKKNIGLAYVPPAAAQPGYEFMIEIRQRKVRARQVILPFYRRPK